MVVDSEVLVFSYMYEAYIRVKYGVHGCVPRLQTVLGIPGEFGFLKKNELFVGRVAMLGFAAELVGEVCAPSTFILPLCMSFLDVCRLRNGQ